MELVLSLPADDHPWDVWGCPEGPAGWRVPHCHRQVHHPYPSLTRRCHTPVEHLGHSPTLAATHSTNATSAEIQGWIHTTRFSYWLSLFVFLVWRNFIHVNVQIFCFVSVWISGMFPLHVEGDICLYCYSSSIGSYIRCLSQFCTVVWDFNGTIYWRGFLSPSLPLCLLTHRLHPICSPHTHIFILKNI